MIYELPCPHCSQAVSAQDDVAGLRVRCPHCQGKFVLPERNRSGFDVPLAQNAAPAADQGVATQPTSASAVAAPSPPPSAPQARFHFHCPLCNSVLEATTGLSGRPGTCPSCATVLSIPELDRRSGQVGQIRILRGDPQDPTPVHAYAAAGGRAPKIVRDEDDRPAIVCPRCETKSPADVDRCDGCGLPFTLEGVSYESVEGTANGYAVLSLVMALIGLPCFALAVPQFLAVVFGVTAVAQISRSPHRRGLGMAVAGLIIGSLSLVFLLLTSMA